MTRTTAPRLIPAAGQGCPRPAPAASARSGSPARASVAATPRALTPGAPAPAVPLPGAGAGKAECGEAGRLQARGLAAARRPRRVGSTAASCTRPGRRWCTRRSPGSPPATALSAIPASRTEAAAASPVRKPERPADPGRRPRRLRLPGHPRLPDHPLLARHPRPGCRPTCSPATAADGQTVTGNCPPVRRAAPN